MRLAVASEADVGAARRLARQAATRAGLDAVRTERAAIVASEAAANLARHATGGELIVGLPDTGVPGVQLLAIDRGPGIADLATALEDGRSTAGTAGEGLGAIRRIADRFDLVSQPGVGTVMLAQILRDAAPEQASFEAGGIVVELAGESESGDAWIARDTPSGFRAMLVDGLGHGAGAAEAAAVALACFDAAAALPLPELAATLHRRLAPTRGAAIGVVGIDAAAPGGRPGTLRFIGIGNIAGTILYPDGNTRALVSMNGIAGHNARRILPFEHPFPAAAALVLHSDGIGTRWTLEPAAVAGHHPAVTAALLYRDHARGRDDASAMLVRRAGRGARQEASPP